MKIILIILMALLWFYLVIKFSSFRWPSLYRIDEFSSRGDVILQAIHDVFFFGVLPVLAGILVIFGRH